MVFDKLKRAFGASGLSVDTVLNSPTVRPGDHVDGVVRLHASNGDVMLERVTLSLLTRVEQESGDHEFASAVEFHRLDVTGGMKVVGGEHVELPFRFPVPWETPVTHVYGAPLRGMTMGVRTEVAVAKAVDKGDLDPIAIEPLPAQGAILEAFERLGFRFKGADLERGHLAGVAQTLPFFQEIEFFPPAYAQGIREVEVTFVANPQSLEVILEVDKRGGMFTPGGGTFRRLRVDHATFAQTDWAAEIDAWIRHAAEYGASHGLFGGHGAYGHSGHGYARGHGHGHGYGRGHGGMGAGAVVGGVAAGLVGGMVAGEVMEEVFEDED